MIGNYLKENYVKGNDRTYINSNMRDIMSTVLEDVLEQEIMFDQVVYSHMRITAFLTESNLCLATRLIKIDERAFEIFIIANIFGYM